MPSDRPSKSRAASPQATWLVAVALVAAAPLHAAQGDLDTSFGSDGELLQPGVTAWNDVAQQADGRIVAGGYRFNDSSMEFVLARYELDGSLDVSFGTDGLVTTDLGGGDDRIEALELQADGRIVVAGRSHNGTDSDFAVARYNADGSRARFLANGRRCRRTASCWPRARHRVPGP